MPHFGQTREVDTYVKQLLVIFHVSFLWLENPHSIDVDIISSIIRLSRVGWDLVENFAEGNYLDKIAQTQEKYGLVSFGEHFIISSIKDPTTRMGPMVLKHKLFCVLRLKQCIAGIVMLATLILEGLQINFSQFFLNEFLQDVISTQEEGTPFHYAWLIILISVIIWDEPADYQQVELHVPCRGARY